MTDTTQDLVTKIDVIPDLSGLSSFEDAIDRATRKVNQLDAAIKRVNNLRPASPYAPPGAAGSMPSAATALALTTIASTGANLVSRTPLAAVVQQQAQKVAKSAVQGIGNGIGLPLLGNGGRGGFMLPPPRGGAGGLFDPTGGNPFAKYDTSVRSFSGEPLNGKMTPTAKGVREATGGAGAEHLIGAGLFTAAIYSVGDVLSSTLDNIQTQQAQLARLPQTVGSATDAFVALNKAASDVRTNGSAFLTVYTNMATATKDLKMSQADIIQAAQGLTSALQLGGGSKEARDAATYQIGQALSSNRFGGDEFKSFMEAIGTMAPEVAKAFGTDVKGLREMSEQGKLTAEIVTKAFQKMAANNMDLLKKQGWTWGQITTVMKNDWQSFIAKSTVGGEWKRFTDWTANTLIPLARNAEKEVAEFWSTLADESKSAILIGILAAVGAAFVALAIPVLAATWPFLAIGAAVLLLTETFIEWKAWMDGKGGTIFDSLFGSFDEFEKRYPSIMKLLNAVKSATDGINKSVENGARGGNDNGDVFHELGNIYNLFGNALGFLEKRGNDFNPLNGIESFLGFFSGDAETAGSAALTGKRQVIISNSNSGNSNVQIVVNDVNEAVDAKNKIDESAANYGVSGNVAEATGAW